MAEETKAASTTSGTGKAASGAGGGAGKASGSDKRKPLDEYSVEELEDELNRRSSEGPNVTSDGSVLQDASAVAIEAEVQHQGGWSTDTDDDDE